MVESEQGDRKNVIVGAALLQEQDQAASIGLDEIVLVRGQEPGVIRVEGENAAIDLHDLMEDVTWCYLAGAKTLFLGSHTGSMVYVVDARNLYLLHRIALRRTDEEYLLKLAFIPTPDTWRVLLLCDERIVGFTRAGAIILNRELRDTDEFVEVSNAGIAIRGVEHEELVYFAFPAPSSGNSLALDRIVRALARQQSARAARASVLSVPHRKIVESTFRETAVLDIGWTSPDAWARQAMPNVLGIALNDITATFIRTQFGIFPTYPVRSLLVPTLTAWMHVIFRLKSDTADVRRGVLRFVGASPLYSIDIVVRAHKCYLRFTRRYIPSDLDLHPPVVMAAERFDEALFQVCERVHGLIKASSIQTAETRAFESAFSRFQSA